MLCSGPGKLTQALGVGLELNTAQLTAQPFEIRERADGLGRRGRRRRAADRDHARRWSSSGASARWGAATSRGRSLLRPSRGGRCWRPRLSRRPSRARVRRRRSAPLLPARPLPRERPAPPATTGSRRDDGRRGTTSSVSVRWRCLGLLLVEDREVGVHDVGKDQGGDGSAVHGRAAELGEHRIARVGVADPDAGGDVRGGAAEPGVAVVVRGAGLAPGGLAGLRALAGARGDDARKRGDGGLGGLGGDDLVADGLVDAAVAVLVLDRLVSSADGSPSKTPAIATGPALRRGHGAGDAVAVLLDRVVGVGHLERRHDLRAQDHRRRIAGELRVLRARTRVACPSRRRP